MRRQRIVRAQTAVVAALLSAGLGLAPALASHQGVSTSSAGTATPSAMTAVASYQTDLSTGRATAGVPIAVPPGRHGMQPTIALSYSSTSPNGALGVGWGLDLGSIQRSTQKGVPFYDDAKDTFTLTFLGVASDLVPVGSGRYRLKDEDSFFKIQWTGSWWEVWDKSGAKYTFGARSDSVLKTARGTVIWAFDRAEDTSGNWMEVAYTTDAGHLYPDKIRYTGYRSSLSPTNEVIFEWEARPDVQTSYRTGEASTLARRLKKIETKAKNLLVRRYEFAYTVSPTTNRSLLTSVTPVGSDGTTRLPPATFTYQVPVAPSEYPALKNTTAATGRNLWTIRILEPSGNWSKPYTTLGTAPGDDFHHVFWYHTDANGNWATSEANSKGGLVVGPAAGHAFQAWTYLYTSVARTLSLSPSAGAKMKIWVDGTETVWTTNLSAGWHLVQIAAWNEQGHAFTFKLGGSPALQVELMNPEVFSTPAIAADCDGDSCADLNEFSAATGDWKVSLAGSTGFKPPVQWLNAMKGSTAIPLVGDLNGDGRDDAVFFTRGAGYWHGAHSKGNSFDWGNPNHFLTDFGKGGTPILGDFDGDGTADPAAYIPATGTVVIAFRGAKRGRSESWVTETWLSNFYTGSSAVIPFTGDFNGDGLTDLAFNDPPNGYWFFSLNQGGSSFPWPSHLYSWWGISKPMAVADYNHDGRTDLGFLEPTTGQLTVRYALGGTTTPSFSDAVPYFGTSATGFTLRNADATFQSADFNGDGLQDVGVFRPVTGESELKLSFGPAPDLLQSLHNGLGGTSLITYAPSVTYQNLGSDGLPSLHFAVQTVASVTTGDGAGHAYRTRTTYSGGRFDPATQEFWGFGYAKASDPDGHFTETWFHQDVHKKGKPSKTQVWSAAESAATPTQVVSQTQTDAAVVVGHDGGDNATVAESFKLPGKGTRRLQAVELHLAATMLNNPSGGLRVRLETDSNGNPSGTLVDPSAVVVLPSPLAASWNLVSFPQSLELETDTPYWIVISYAGPVQGNTGYRLAGSSSNAYPDGLLMRRYPSGSWHEMASPGIADLAFRVSYVAPPPSAAPKLLQEVTNTWTCTEPAGGVHVCVLGDQTTKLYDGAATAKETKVAYTYDAYGNVTKVVESGDLGTTGDERTTTTDYAVNESVWIVGTPSHTVVKDANNAVVRESWIMYDGNTSWTQTPRQGFVTKEEVWLSTSASKPASAYAYDDYGNRTKATDPLGRVTTTAYDAEGIFPVTVTNALGHTLKTTYDPGTGNVLTTTDPNGQVTTNQYDPVGRLVKVIGPLATADYPDVRYEYDLTARPIKITKQVLTTKATAAEAKYDTVYTFADGMGRVIQVKTPADNPAQQIVSETKTFDARGLVAEVALPVLVDTSQNYTTLVPASPKTTFQYDPLGRLLRQTNPDGTFSTTAYDRWMVTLTDEAGKQKIRYTDAYGHLVKVQEKNGTETYTTTYAYDGVGNLTKTTDHKGNVATISYDSLGRKTKMSDPDMGTWEYAYDAVGNLLTQKDAKGQTLTFAYDALNRLVRKTVPGTGTVPGTEVLYLYDDPAKANALGRLSKVTYSHGSTEFFYDLLGREIKTIKAVDNVSYSFERTYDAASRVTTLKYPDGEILSYTYSAQGIKTVKSATATYVSNVDYTAHGQIAKQVVNGNLMATTYTYDPNTLRLNTLVTTNGANMKLQDLSYAFDPVGNVKTLTDNRRNQTQSFTYDDLHRLTQAVSPRTYGTRTYAYDPIGNLIQKDGATLTYGHPTKPHAVTQFSPSSPGSPISLSYDANGNMVTKGPQTLTYDAENRLVEVQQTLDAPSSFTVTLKPGWNFFTTPYNQADLTFKGVFGASWGTDIDQISRFNPTTQRFEHAGPIPRYNAFDKLEPGRGYQVHATKTVTLTLSGTVSPPTWNLPAGWALMGTFLLAESPLTEALSGLTAGTDYSDVRRYDGAALVPATTVRPGEALWIKLKRAVTWTPKVHHDVHTRFAYDGDGGRVAKITQAGTANARTTTYIGKLYEVKPDGSTVKYIWVGSTRLASKSSTGTLLFYHPNHLGSTDLVTDGQGTQVAHYEYTPYGELFSTEGLTVPHLFTGKELDPETGFYFYEARYYDPQLGRFLTPDSIVPNWTDPQDFNRYTYAANNPLKYTDPTGHKPFWKKVKKFFKKFGSTLLSIAAIIAAPFSGGLSLALWAGSALIGGIQAAQAGQFGAWALGFGVSMALGFAFPVKFDSLFMQVGVGALRGAAIGAISGGLSSVAAGGSFGAGALQGAIGGSIGGATSAFFTSQQFTNWREGYGFHSNQGVIGSLYNQGKFQEAIDFSVHRYGITSASGATYDPKMRVDQAGATDIISGRITIGPEAFTKPGPGLGPFDASRLPGTLFHEGVHAQQVASGRIAAHMPITNMTRAAFESEAYGQTLGVANQLNLSPDVREYYKTRYGEELKPQQIRDVG